MSADASTLPLATSPHAQPVPASSAPPMEPPPSYHAAIASDGSQSPQPSYGSGDSSAASAAPSGAAAEQSEEERQRHLQSVFTQYVNAKACYGKRVASELSIVSSEQFAAYHCQQLSLLEKRVYVWHSQPAQQFDAVTQLLVMPGQEPSPWVLPSPSQVFNNSVGPDSRYLNASKQQSVDMPVAGSAHIAPCTRCHNGTITCQSCIGRGTDSHHRRRCAFCRGTGRKACNVCSGQRFLLKTCSLQFSWTVVSTLLSLDTLPRADKATGAAAAGGAVLPAKIVKRHLQYSLTQSTAGPAYKGHVLCDVEQFIDWRAYDTRQTSVTVPDTPSWHSLPPALRERVQAQYDSDHWQKTCAPGSQQRMLSHRILISGMPVIFTKYRWAKVKPASDEEVQATAEKDYAFLTFGKELDAVYESDYPLNCCGCFGEKAAVNCHPCSIM